MCAKKNTFLKVSKSWLLLTSKSKSALLHAAKEHARGFKFLQLEKIKALNFGVHFSHPASFPWTDPVGPGERSHPAGRGCSPECCVGPVGAGGGQGGDCLLGALLKKGWREGGRGLDTSWPAVCRFFPLQPLWKLLVDMVSRGETWTSDWRDRPVTCCLLV